MDLYEWYESFEPTVREDIEDIFRRCRISISKRKRLVEEYAKIDFDKELNAYSLDSFGTGKFRANSDSYVLRMLILCKQLREGTIDHEKFGAIVQDNIYGYNIVFLDDRLLTALPLEVVALCLDEEDRDFLLKINQLEDFSTFSENFSVDDLPTSWSYKTIKAVFGKDKTKEYYAQHLDRVDSSTYRRDEECREMIDSIFFENQELPDTLRAQFLRNLYNNGSLYTAASLFENIIPKYPKMLLYLPQIFTQSAVFRKLYQLRIEDYSIPEDATYPDLNQHAWRFNKDLRKVLLLASVCGNMKCAKTNSRRLGDLAVLIKMYGYDYKTIVSAMFPELI